MYRDYVIFVAEVASTCNEALLMEYLLNRTTDKKERAWLINHFLEQFKGTLYRQTMFAEFELRIGQLAAQGETLTADLLSREYRALNEDYFGPDMVIDDEIALGVGPVSPHLLLQLLCVPVRHRLLRRHRPLPPHPGRRAPPAVKDYLGFLSGGCSQDPIDLLRGAGGGYGLSPAHPGRSGPVRPASGRNGGADLSGLTSTRKPRRASPYAWPHTGKRVLA